MQDFVKIAEQVLVSCLGVKKDESVLVITDDTRKEIGEALYQAACDLGCEGLLMVMKEREVSGQEPPKAVAEAMKAADVVIAPTAKSLTHTAARIQAAAAGTMVGIGKLESPLHMKISGGKLREVTGDKSENLEILLKNETNGTLCELGIGTNEAAILNGIILEDEKVYGTVHIAFGTNASFGGVNKAECHMDGIILRPTLYLDDTLVIKEGVFQV